MELLRSEYLETKSFSLQVVNQGIRPRICIYKMILTHSLIIKDYLGSNLLVVSKGVVLQITLSWYGIRNDSERLTQTEIRRPFSHNVLWMLRSTFCIYGIYNWKRLYNSILRSLLSLRSKGNSVRMFNRRLF